MKNRLLVGVILLLCIFNFFLLKKSSDREIDLIYKEEELASLLEEIYPANVMIDLRDREDYEAGHIDGFINIPTSDGEEVMEYLKKKRLEKKSIYLMCYSGKRAAATFEMLHDKGFKHLTYITFGYDDYVKSQDDFTPKTGQCDCLAE